VKPGFLKGETANKRCYSLVDERKKEKSRIGRSRFASVRITLGGFYLGENKRCPPTTRIMRLAEYCRPGGSEKSGQFLLFSDLLPLANISVNSRRHFFIGLPGIPFLRSHRIGHLTLRSIKSLDAIRLGPPAKYP
jgi:hypothetical protein